MLKMKDILSELNRENRWSVIERVALPGGALSRGLRIKRI